MLFYTLSTCQFNIHAFPDIAENPECKQLHRFPYGFVFIQKMLIIPIRAIPYTKRVDIQNNAHLNGA